MSQKQFTKNRKIIQLSQTKPYLGQRSDNYFLHGQWKNNMIANLTVAKNEGHMTTLLPSGQQNRGQPTYNIGQELQEEV